MFPANLATRLEEMLHILQLVEGRHLLEAQLADAEAAIETIRPQLRANVEPATRDALLKAYAAHSRDHGDLTARIELERDRAATLARVSNWHADLVDVDPGALQVMLQQLQAMAELAALFRFGTRSERARNWIRSFSTGD